MKNYTVPMALVDFIPVILFTIAAIVLQRYLYSRINKGAFVLFAAGTLDVVCAGFGKALYKLLNAANICDFKPLNNIFFPLQSLGFILAGIGILALVFSGQTQTNGLAVIHSSFMGTPLFITLMVLGVALIDIVLCIIAVQMGKPMLVVIFALSFLLELSMGYLSSRDFTQAAVNWCVQGINVLSQGLLLFGALALRK